jgi:hypothetical protein
MMYNDREEQLPVRLLTKHDYYEFVIDYPVTLRIDGIVKVAETNLMTVQEIATLARPIIKS